MARELFVIEDETPDGPVPQVVACSSRFVAEHFAKLGGGELKRVTRYVPEDTTAETKLTYHRARAKLLLERFERERLPGEVVEALRELAGEI